MLAALGAVFMIPPIARWVFHKVHPHINQVTEILRIPSPTLFPVMALCLCLGAIRYQLSQPALTPGFIAYFNDQPSAIIIQGIVIEPADVRETYTNLRVQVEQVQTASQSQIVPVRGLLLARVPNSVTFNYGDRIQLQGKLLTPPENEDFSYRDYLANRGIYSYLPYPSTSLVEAGQGHPLMAVLFDFKQKAINEVYSLFPDPEAGLLAGILLGVQTGISSPLQEAFRQTGTSHIVVISGFNITVIAGLFTFLFSRLLGRYKGAIVAAIGIILYTLLVGANAAVVRAAILGLFTLLGHLVGRRQAGLNSLTFVGAVMAMLTPTVLWDVSFQLSFAATLGIMLYAEPMTEWFISSAARFIPPDKAEKLAGPVGEYLLLTLAAQITTLPLMIYYFKRLSLTALVANPMILPAQPAVEIIGGLAVLAGLVFRPLGLLLAWAAWPFIAYTIRMVEWMATIPNGSIVLSQVAFPTIVLFYAVLFTVSFARAQIKNVADRISPALPLAVLGVVAVLLWRAVFSSPDGKLHVTVLDVGTGDGVLIQTPGGREVLINGGASTNRLSEALGRRMPFFYRSLDWLVVADIDEEDVAGIAGNLERFRPSNVLWAGNTAGTRAAGELWSQIGDLSIPTTMAQPGQALDLGDGARLSVLSAGGKGAVLWLEWENFRMLLPIGIDLEAMDALQKNPAMRNVSSLLLAESGYAPTNPPGLIKLLNPQVAMLSVAAADRTGLPSPETIKALEGYNLVRTDQNGWIEITTDGKQMWAEAERDN
jgi:competence protein ComEC